MKEQPKKQNFLSCLLTYASESKPKMIASVILSVISITSGLIPFYCFYRIIGLFMENAVTTQDILFWSICALAAYVVKIVCFGLSTTTSHYAAYHILEGLRNRVTERFLKAPLGEVTKHSIGEIKGIMVDKIEDMELPLAHMIPEGSGHIVLPIVSMIALALPQGSFTALVGPSGGGKSTVAKLISRFYDVTKGSISIGGTDIRDMSLAQLTETISFVAQDNFLFLCSLEENIRMGNPDATDEEVYAAAKAAQCEEFIQKLPMGYDTPAGDAGKRLSGGEKQRIAIARMMLKNAPVVILDEATASVDPENEHLIQEAISQLTRGKTIITIAHRLATIEQADQILVVDGGKIVQKGTHKELIGQEGKYRDFIKVREQAEEWQIA